MLRNITVSLIFFILVSIGLSVLLYDASKKIDELEKSLISCLNKQGGFIVGDELFICEAIKISKTNESDFIRR